MEEKTKKEEKKIKHLVISGGGHSFFTFYGILNESQKQNYVIMDNIESIYGTSAGALIGFILSLRLENEILDKYLIDRPWGKIFNINIEQIFGMFDNLGIYGKSHMCEIINPLLCSKDLSPDITLLELYEYNNIEFHSFATELNELQCIDFSYKTHPSWKVADVLAATCAIPLIFKPVFIDDKCYIDGCITNDFPILEFMKDHDVEDAFFIKKENHHDIAINKFSTFTNYITSLIQKLLIKSVNYTSPKNLVMVTDSLCTLNEILDVSSNEDKRKELINVGVELFNSFISKSSM